MARRLLVLAGLLLASVCGSASSARADSSGCTWCGHQVVTSDSDGWNVAGLISGGAVGTGVPGGAGPGGPEGPPSTSSSTSASSSGPLIEYDYRSTCDLPGGNGGCAGGTLKCTARDTQSVFVAQRQVTPAVGPWSLQPGSVCLTPAQQLPWSPAQLQAFVDGYFRRLPLPLPALNLQPNDRAVVNLPLVASTDAPQQTTFTVNQAPFPTITITATVRWQWSWGDGASDSSSWPGRPYDGTDPRTSPGHYISHPYTAPSPGAQISVTAVWSGSYSVAGMGSQAIDGTVQRTTNRTMPVSEYGATLTGN